MALRGNLVGFMRSVMKINLNPFESHFSTGIISTGPKSTPLGNPLETSNQVSSATMNSSLNVSKQLSSAPLNNPFEASKMFSPPPLCSELVASNQFTDLGQAKYPDPNISHQEKFDYDSGSDNNALENTGYKVGSLAGPMALFSTMVSPTEQMDKKTEQLVELLSQAHKEHERNNFTLAYKIYETANKFVEGKRQIKEFSDKECLNYRIFIHDNVAAMAYKQGYYWKAVGAYKAMMCDHEQLGRDKTDYVVVQTMIKLATVYALKKDGDTHLLPIRHRRGEENRGGCRRQGSSPPAPHGDRSPRAVSAPSR